MGIQTDESIVFTSELNVSYYKMRGISYLPSVQNLTMNETSFNSDAKVKFYTGLPSFATLKAIYGFVAPCNMHSFVPNQI